MKSPFVADGFLRLTQGPEFEAKVSKLRESVRLRHSEELAEAGFLRRLALHWRIAVEFQRERRNLYPSTGSLYSSSLAGGYSPGVVDESSLGQKAHSGQRNKVKALRIFLLLFITLMLCMMAACPALHDSQRRHRAFLNYRNAPSEETRRQLEEAQRLDRENVKVFEFVMLGILGLSVYAFIRAGKGLKWPGSASS